MGLIVKWLLTVFIHSFMISDGETQSNNEGSIVMTVFCSCVKAQSNFFSLDFVVTCITCLVLGGGDYRMKNSVAAPFSNPLPSV